MKLPLSRTGLIAALVVANFWPTTGLSQGRGIISPVPPAGSITQEPPPRQFYLRSYVGKCLDFNPPPHLTSPQAPAQIVLYDCNGSVSQKITITEVDSWHHVILQAGGQVIGIHNPMVNTLGGASAGSTGPPVFALELQKRAGRDTVFSRNQIFAIDGDSIILAANRSLVIQVQNARGANWSPVVVASRQLAHFEFWNFNQIDGADIDPTTGFVRVATRGDLLIALFKINQLAQQNNGSRGSVIKILDSGEPIDLTLNPNLALPIGVTVRGDRRGVRLGPELVGKFTQEASMFDIQGDDVRITGLRMRGPTRSTNTNLKVDAIQAHRDLFTGTLIDQNDLSDWPNAAVEVFGGQHQKLTCDGATPDLSLNDRVRIERNFIHHNDNGYGAVMSDGGTATVARNVFSMNWHAIAADGEVHDQYSALFNLVLSDLPKPEQDFDMHGTNPNHNYGRFAGNEVIIVGNTFLGGNRDNFDLRGQPCAVGLFQNNVSMQRQDRAIKVWDFNSDQSDGKYITFSIPWLRLLGNQFSLPNPANHVDVGDFDGDGVQDLFLATGTAWYYSAQGVAEWRFLSAKTDTIDSLLFGDFDGDGRTDVIARNGNDLMVSWGGTSEWEKLNTVAGPVADLAVGKFAGHLAGDRRDDLFWANGQEWLVSADGSGPFTPVQTSSARVRDLRFGDFNGDGITDVFGIVAGKWNISYGAASNWTALPVSLTNTVDGLVVADFDGDGFADVATSSYKIVNEFYRGWEWKFSRSGASDWSYRWPGPPAQSSALWNAPLSSAVAIGLFDLNPGADVLLWGSANNSPNDLSIVSGGPLKGPVPWPQQSRQQMR